MKKVLGVILGGLLLLPVVSNAADAQKAADNKKPVNSWTCEDFLAVDESFQPTAVGFAEALNNKDKPEDAVLDVQGIATVTPAIVLKIARTIADLAGTETILPEHIAEAIQYRRALKDM